EQPSAVSRQPSAVTPKEEPRVESPPKPSAAGAREPTREQAVSGQRSAVSPPKPRTRDPKRAEAEARQHKSRVAAPLRARLKEVESEIAKAEARIQILTDQMANPDLYKDGDRAREVARERKALEEQVRSLYGKWEELALRLESVTAGGAS
ncbi:MAG TPA: ABC transporter C-terminal domain-containing protein, partial [Candidatus Acidoferrum sp.]|nr:ABC transporter C-terminal domain-containing protein [Candidatus Acidoferrum sp.]